MLHECRAIHVLRDHFERRIWWWHSISKFGSRKGQIYVKLGQIWSHFQIQNFLTKPCLSCPVLSQGSTIVIYVLCTTIANAKNCVSIKWRHHLYLFLGYCTTKNKNILLKFCMRVICMYPNPRPSPVFRHRRQCKGLGVGATPLAFRK